MSKARLVVAAVMVEKRKPAEVARSYGVAQSWVYTLPRRYQAEGEAAFGPRSRRPRTSPSAISPGTAELIVRLRKDLSGQAWTPARTPSPGIWSITTGSGSRRPPSAAP
jgi:transposase